jgi:hypothetical protein
VKKLVTIIALCFSSVLLLGADCGDKPVVEKKPLDLIKPAGGESFTVGTPVDIDWEINADNIGSVSVLLSNNGGLSFDISLVTPSIPPATATNLSWTPTAEQVGTDCMIKIYDYTDESKFDVSEKFTVAEQ